MAMPDMRTASVASANEENLAAAVTIRSMTDELKACSSRPRAVRRGEKVPTAVGTVGDAFDLLDLGSLGSERAGVGFGGTELSAGGTGLLGGELVGLLFEEQLEGSLGQSLGGGGGDLLEGSEVDIESGSVVPEGPLGDDLGPLAGEVVELLEFLGCEAGRRHALSCQVDAAMRGWEFPIPPSIHRKANDKP
jgi:hypothetical protein